MQEIDENEENLLTQDQLYNREIMEDDFAVAQSQAAKPSLAQFSKKSPNVAVSSNRKGSNLANISNTVHGQRQASN